MKFPVIMNTPDALEQAITEAVKQHGERKDGDINYEEVKRFCRRWFRYSKVIFLEIDTEAKTCTVLER